MNSGLRILYVSPVDISRPNGPGVNEREFVVSLVKNLGNRVSIIVPKPIWHLGELPKADLHYVHQQVKRSISSLLLTQIDIARKVERFLRRERYDLVVLRIGLLPFGLMWVAWRHNVPIAIKTLGDVKFLERGRGIKGLLGKVLAPAQRMMVSEIVKNSIAIDACTPELVEQITKEFSVPEEKIQMIPNATNTERFSPRDRMKSRKRIGIDRFDPVIGFVGGRPEERGGMQIVEMLQELSDIYPKIGCLIVGEPVGRLEELARTLKVSERCVFAGLVPYHKVPDYVNCFDVGIALEGARLNVVGNSFQKIRQYLACGVPVVSAGGGKYLEEFKLGSQVHHGSNTEVVGAVKQWLGKGSAKKVEFQQKAYSYVQENLSVDKTFMDRIDLWSRRILAWNEQQTITR